MIRLLISRKVRHGITGPGKKKEGHLVAILIAYHKLNAVLLSRVPGLQAAARSGGTRPRGKKGSFGLI